MRARYFTSYIGIVLCACVLIGLLGLSRAITEINTASLADYQEKMVLAAEELESQQEILENISYRVRSSTMYRPFFTYRNAYYEVEIVEDIEKYKDYSPLIDEYYCILRETDSVYSTRGKLTIDQFVQYRLQGDESIVTSLFAKTGYRIMEHPCEADMLMIVIPFRVQTDGLRDVPDTCLIFMVSRSTLASRLERISSLDTSALTIYWNDLLLLGDSAGREGEQTLSAVSENGQYRIYSGMQPAQIYQRLNDFRQYFMLVLAIGTSILLVVAAYIAHRSYQPIDRLISRLNIPQNGSEQDIEAAVKALQDSQSYTKEQLQNDLIDIARQRREIAKQLLFAKLNGVRDAHMDSLLEEAGIALNHPLFCVMLVHFKGELKKEEVVSAMTRSLSDDDLSIHPAGLYQAKAHILLLNFTAREQLDDICTVLRESFEVEEGGATLYVGDVCEDMSQLPMSFVSAIVRREAEFTDETPQSAGWEAGWYDDRQVRLMMQALREGNSLKVQTCLAEAGRVFREKYPSMVLQRCIWADVGSQLLRTTREMDVQLDQKSLHMLFMAVDTDSFMRQLSQLLEQISAMSNERTETESRQTEREVVDYIAEHLFSLQFTMAEVATEFGLSERKIGNIVKLVTGMSYKEYIIQLRMERAKVMLTAEGRNVSQTSEGVGYNNIPYFIKTFRNYTGYTPGEYKKLFDKQEEEAQ